MKYLIITILIITLLSSCVAVKERCPAYSKVDKIEKHV